MKKILTITSAVIYLASVPVFLIDPQRWVSDWPGVASVAVVYILAAMFAIECAFEPRHY